MTLFFADGLGACSGGEPEEAEYAWLPMHCLKPFELGDAAKHAGRESANPEDANLSACVAAAERALTGMLGSRRLPGGGGEDDEAESTGESDSDGGARIFLE
jgi:hypothetical protein